MNKKVKIGQKGGVVTLTDKNYKAAGGEANIYVNGGMVFKLYHDPAKKILPAQKIQELGRIINPNVVTPKDIIYDASNGEALGYTAPYIDGAEPLLKLFTRTFKQDNSIDPKMIAELVKQLQLGTFDIHKAKCLIVDFNELNVLVNVGNTLVPWFIDTDSYATPSYKATAIMDSVRDRRVSSYDKAGKLIYNPDEMSDWFSWAILSFWLYTNIHPYRGNHKDYKPKDKQKQMDDGVSVFHAGVRVPPVANDFSLIPPRHLSWFKDVFLNGNRSVPPLADSLVPLTVPNTIVIVKGTNKVDVTQIGAYSEMIAHVCQYMGINYVVTNKRIYGDQKPLMDLNNVKKVLTVPSSDGTMVVATQSGDQVTFTELMTSKLIGSISTSDMFVRNNSIYTVANGKLIENCFTTLGNKTIHRTTEVENVSNLSAKVYEGCVIQDLLCKFALTIPIKKGACVTKFVPQLDGYRIIDCKSDKWVTVVIGEKKGQYDKFIIVFNKDYSDFDIRKIEDVAVDVLNFTVMDNGLCVMLNDDDLELFVNNQKVEVLENAPLDSSMKLFSTPTGIFFINGNSVHQIKRK